MLQLICHVAGPDPRGRWACFFYAPGSNKNGGGDAKKDHYHFLRIDAELQNELDDKTAGLKNTYGALVQWGDDSETFDYGSDAFGSKEWPDDVGTTVLGFRQTAFHDLDLDDEDGRAAFVADVLNVGCVRRSAVQWVFKSWME